MRIYTRVVWQWQPDGTLKKVPEECESFDYEGPVALCKDSPSPPPAPDYKGAAEATAASQRVNQYTPYGSMTWANLAPDIPGPTHRTDIQLAPIAQKTLDTQMNLSNQMGDLTQQQIPGVQQQYNQPMDMSSVPQIADQAYRAQTSRLDPQWNEREQQLRTQLANQGLVAGGEAYDKEMRNLNQGRNDAYTQARLASISTMPQTYQLATSAYNQPLNIFNALRTGAQVQNPQFQSPGAMPQTNYLGAAQAQGGYDQGLFNSKVGQQNAMTQGLFGLGGAGLMAYGLRG